MALVTTDLGELELLDKMLKDALTVDENYVLQLFNHAEVVSAATVSADFTASTFTNYVAKTLTRANFSVAATVGGKSSATVSTALSWTCGATGDTVFGYWVVGGTSGTTLWAERFGSSRTLADGDVLNLTPVFTLNSETATSP